MPAGFYQVPGLPYPRAPRPPVDPNDLLRDTSMDPDMGAGTAPPRDPYLNSLPPRPAQDAATRAAVVRLQPGRTTPFSGRDAQALATLDPRALAEAQSIASLDQPKTITGTFGGQSFEMTPSVRVNRNNLAQIYNKYLTKQGEEKAAAQRAEAQAGKERIVSIPGEQATKRREMELGAEERIAGKKIEAEAPERQARIAAENARTAAAIGAEKRAAEAPDRERQMADEQAINDALARAEASPFAQTPAGRAAISALRQRSTIGRVAPEAAAAASAPQERPITDIATEMLADPTINALLKSSRQKRPGFFTGTQGRREAAAASALLQRAIQDFANRYDVAATDLQPYLATIQ